LYDPRFGQRMRGVGQRWALIEQLFDATCKRLGINEERIGEAETASTFQRPTRQLPLW
jgi:hypothetical protein